MYRREVFSSYRNHYQRVHEHSWKEKVHPDPDECGCRCGWVLSSCDVWEKCPHHFDGQDHPEHRFPTAAEEEQALHEVHIARCREERIDDLMAAHEAALEEKARRENDVPGGSKADGDEGNAASEPDALPF